MRTFAKWMATMALPPVAGWLCLMIFKLMILLFKSAPEDSDACLHPQKTLLLVAVGEVVAGFLAAAVAYELAPRAKMASSILVVGTWACALCWLVRGGGYWIDVACWTAGAVALFFVVQKNPRPLGRGDSHLRQEVLSFGFFFVST